ncbi:hypothetical protein [Thioalkalivibrio sp. ALE16]|uniref:hypothetical protein n=1 Tax=Thioalkalivibrio sp. ALE16 TaxID=1158172 RepID=UPI00036E035E|nr:hypothetical protein [Thioalkalivibrio sp. ALE16]
MKNHLNKYQIAVPVGVLDRPTLEGCLQSPAVPVNAHLEIERVLRLIPSGELPGHGYFLGSLVVGGIDLSGIGQGARVRVPKGAYVRCIGGHSEPARKARVVTVHQAQAGFMYEPDIRAAHIVWVGSGGRWCKASLDDIYGLGGAIVEPAPISE